MGNSIDEKVKRGVIILSGPVYEKAIRIMREEFFKAKERREEAREKVRARQKFSSYMDELYLAA